MFSLPAPVPTPRRSSEKLASLTGGSTGALDIPGPIICLWPTRSPSFSARMLTSGAVSGQFRARS
jgi:hypothetical protein